MHEHDESPLLPRLRRMARRTALILVRLLAGFSLLISGLVTLGYISGFVPFHEPVLMSRPSAICLDCLALSVLMLSLLVEDNEAPASPTH